jgi:hypothetical protein
MLPVHLFQQNSSSLMQCTPSIECQPQYEHLASGVVSIYAVDPKSKTIGLCSGKLDCQPAAHQQGRCQWLQLQPECDGFLSVDHAR